MQASSAEGASSDSGAAASPPLASLPGNNAAANLRALCLLARLHHISATPDLLAHELGLSPSAEASDTELLLAAKHIGLKAKLSRTTGERLSMAALPALARIKGEDGTERWVLLAQCDGQRVLYQDPAAEGGGRPTIEPMEAFVARWALLGNPMRSGTLLLATSRASLVGAVAKFDFSWFVPSIVKHRKLMGEVLLVSLFLQLFALVSPLFFQVVMDKVLVHRGLTTLDVLVIGLVIVGGAAALKALVPIEPTWTWLLTAGQILSALGLYFTVPGTTAQQVAHANAAPSPVVVK